MTSLQLHGYLLQIKRLRTRKHIFKVMQKLLLATGLEVRVPARADSSSSAKWLIGGFSGLEVHRNTGNTAKIATFISPSFSRRNELL